MAVIESKRSVSLAQPRARKTPKSKKQNQLPASLRYTTTKRGKTTIRSYDGRTFYRFDEIKCKNVDFVEVFVCAEYNCVDVRFDDKTSLTFAIEPAFTLETEHADWKTGNWRPIKRWPNIRSAGFNS